ncbi:MAG: FAD-binding oxidoreductase [Candidatus Paracaedibacteraceae bacterium]|nr:FAD-binding oxidoreductase [Candidatus Paracaedibacteraceae bacterium]
MIGTGFIGCLTALHLWERGYKNLVMVTDQSLASATANAGGYIAASISSEDPEEERYNRFCLDSFNNFSNAMKGSHPFITGGNDVIRRLPIYRTGGKSPALENYVRANLIAPGFDVNLHIIDTEKTHQLYCYEEAIYVNSKKLLRQLHRHLTNYNIPILHQQITHLNQINSSVIFNCTDSLAGKLRGKEEEYTPILGHYILLGNQDLSPKSLSLHNSMIVVTGGTYPIKIGLEVRTSLNLFPKTSLGKEQEDNYQAYLGTTFIKDIKLNDQGYAQKDYEYPELFDGLLKNAQEFFGKSVN